MKKIVNLVFFIFFLTIISVMAGQQKLIFAKEDKPIFDLKINKSEVIAEKIDKLGHITWALEVCSKKKKTSAQYQIANRDY